MHSLTIHDFARELTWISRALKQHHWQSYGTDEFCMSASRVYIFGHSVPNQNQTKKENLRISLCTVSEVLWPSFSKHICGSLDSVIWSRRWTPVGQLLRSLHDTVGERENIFHIHKHALKSWVNWLSCSYDLLCSKALLKIIWRSWWRLCWFSALVNWFGWSP